MILDGADFVVAYRAPEHARIHYQGIGPGDTRYTQLEGDWFFCTSDIRYAKKTLDAIKRQITALKRESREWEYMPWRVS